MIGSNIDSYSLFNIMKFCPFLIDQINVIIQIVKLIPARTNSQNWLIMEAHKTITSIIKSVRANNRVLNVSKTLFPLYEAEAMNDLPHKNNTILKPQKQIQENNHSLILIKSVSNH